MNELKQLYNEVFDIHNKIRYCGRDKCVALIVLMEQKFPNVDFGNKSNGFLNIKNIQEYYQKL